MVTIVEIITKEISRVTMEEIITKESIRRLYQRINQGPYGGNVNNGTIEQ